MLHVEVRDTYGDGAPKDGSAEYWGSSYSHRKDLWKLPSMMHARNARVQHCSKETVGLETDLRADAVSRTLVPITVRQIPSVVAHDRPGRADSIRTRICRGLYEATTKDSEMLDVMAEQCAASVLYEDRGNTGSDC